MALTEVSADDGAIVAQFAEWECHEPHRDRYTCLPIQPITDLAHYSSQMIEQLRHRTLRLFAWTYQGQIITLAIKALNSVITFPLCGAVRPWKMHGTGFSQSAFFIRQNLRDHRIGQCGFYVFIEDAQPGEMACRN